MPFQTTHSNRPFWTAIIVLSLTLTGCKPARLPTIGADLGQPASIALLTEAVTGGSSQFPLRVRTVLSARWEVDRGGLINLNHPRARAAGLTAGSEPIEIYTHVIEHPTNGRFLIDSGVSREFAEPGRAPSLSWLVRTAMGIGSLRIETPTAALRDASNPIRGVFLTHLHLDHIMGFGDLPEGIRTVAGPGELSGRTITNALAQGSLNRLLAPVTTLEEWPFTAPASADDLSVIDVFQDQSLWAIHAPGHTPGSTVYLALAEDGAHLFLGDLSHTAWGWKHGVEPGTFNNNMTQSARSFAKIRAWAQQFPEMKVHLGHQELTQ